MVKKKIIGNTVEDILAFNRPGILIEKFKLKRTGNISTDMKSIERKLREQGFK